MRRRRVKYQWLEPLGLEGPAADLTDDTVGRDFLLTVPTNGTTASIVKPIVADATAEDAAAAGPMGYNNNNDYIVKRIVGKIFIAAQQQSSSTTSAGFLVAAGIFAARAADQNVAADIPIGATSSGLITAEYGPLRLFNSMQPWIWRRSWVLSNRGFTGASPTNSTFPQNNVDGFGSALDGPHIDAKTARRVNKEERLWLVVSARNYQINATATTATNIYGYFEGRFLGRMARARNRGVF